MIRCNYPRKSEFLVSPGDITLTTLSQPTGARICAHRKNHPSCRRKRATTRQSRETPGARRRWPILAVLLLLGVHTVAQAMQADGCGAEDCRSCHSLSKDEARGLLKELRLKVLDVAFSEVPGLWVVDVQNPQGRQGPVYVDFSKQHLIKGTILKLATKENLTQQRLIERNRIDPSVIPLDDALVIGNPKAQNRIVVFDDPQCKFCRKLHPELKRLTKTRDDVAFYVQMFPLKGNPTSYNKAKAIVCAKSLQMLEASLAGKKLPPPECDTDAVDRNLEIGQLIGVRSTPTLVFPDGRVVPGYKTAEKIAELLGE